MVAGTERARDMEEAIKLLAQEQRHARQLEAAEREKLALLLQRETPMSRDWIAKGWRIGRARYVSHLLARP